MPSYTIYEKPDLPLEEAIDSAILVKNHYSMLAFFLPLVWMLVKRLWWVLLIYVLLLIPLFALESILPVWSGMLMTLLVSLWLCLEAPNLIGWSLKRKGYIEVASLFAEDRDHCERRYVQAKVTAGDAVPKSKSMVSTPSTGNSPINTKDRLRESAPKGPIIGLFPAPGQS
ncbi:DUF2628 domain-containing protein [Cohaesibacter celericrescens]|uniref:DUF2628 domain-containing protein n=1 Tax=Cohaesibacter celericrescens TaxID=2067669 RepID=A0A2N5XP93_9HYPH|nr:DUF2628 domain-containing protein [Cohaesibacter celericrescens]PLW76240.1 hypothetical protein C0081_15165 [Cohaesibacter celericrescens]